MTRIVQRWRVETVDSCKWPSFTAIMVHLNKKCLSAVLVKLTLRCVRHWTAMETGPHAYPRRL